MKNEDDIFDVCIIGAGVIGSAIAKKLSEQFKVLVLEKDSLEVVNSKTNRYSGVIHAEGVYFLPYTNRARYCLNGYKLLYDYCESKKGKVKFKKCGQLILANSEINQQKELLALFENGKRNGFNLALIKNKQDLKESGLESKITGLDFSMAIYASETGVCDGSSLLESFREDVLKSQTKSIFLFNKKVINLEKNDNDENITIVALDSENNSELKVRAKYVVNAAGYLATQLAANNSEVMQIEHEDIPKQKYTFGINFKYNGEVPFDLLAYPLPTVRNGNRRVRVHNIIKMTQSFQYFGPYQVEVDDLNKDKITGDADKDYNLEAHKINIDNIKKEAIQDIKEYFPGLNEDLLSFAGETTGILSRTLTKNSLKITDYHIIGKGRLINLFGIESPGFTSCLAIANQVNQLIFSLSLKNAANRTGYKSNLGMKATIFSRSGNKKHMVIEETQPKKGLIIRAKL